MSVDMKLVVNMTLSFVIIGAMIGLLSRWAIQNKRGGYRRPLRQPLITEGLRMLGDIKAALKDNEPPKETVPTAPMTGPTPIEQLVALSLAVQAGNPVAEGSADDGQKTEPSVSADEELVTYSPEKAN